MALTYVVPAPGETTGSILDERGGLAAHVYANDPLGRKMAAAPELVEALRACQLALRATSKAAKDYSHEVDLARAALKKAGVESVAASLAVSVAKLRTRMERPPGVPDCNGGTPECRVISEDQCPEHATWCPKWRKVMRPAALKKAGVEP